ncbi:endonuclease V [Variovorax sp. GB1P17]|uniref:endonuclease V n=1 Tax=Variovorax sp. GB1P17 TaxID=3443740 RepID=UPI003F488225
MTEPLLVCLDVDYRADTAVAAGVWFRGWTAAHEETQAVAGFGEVAAYEPGEFYRRELPCLLGVLREGPPADIVIVDGYATLEQGHAGLGAHLHEALGRKVPVVGVAKTAYRSASDAIEVRRGGSGSPLFVTAVGIDVALAAQEVRRMHGPYRVPTLLRAVDQLARNSAMPDHARPAD